MITIHQPLSEQDAMTLRASALIMQQSWYQLLTALLTILLGIVLVGSALSKFIFAVVCALVWLCTFAVVSLQYGLHVLALKNEQGGQGRHER